MKNRDKEMGKDEYIIKPIARIESDFREKFGVPRQPGLVTAAKQKIVFEQGFDNADALRGLDGFSYVWLVWGFSEARLDMAAESVDWSPTVRPPKLGGKVRMGVWATRSPYRPNSLGLSAVCLEAVSIPDEGAPHLIVSGADLVDGTPIYDIKPYIPYSDCHPEALGGWTSQSGDFQALTVAFSPELLELVDKQKREALMQALSLDPRGAYEKQSGYRFGMSFADYNVEFTVDDSTLTVIGVEVRG